ncbi:hypothetical protein Leryth_009210 [Lithospermum erythrorhizon]|uniref:Uncharacterized protein n=1 Tax=Lithospermum erythrorhizon TaxID=34254 RepID=A0AAV3QMF0_LITER|nr:hypothetical protein Leryth_009210 [Lithospermum erythrorhizon]
MRGVGGPLLCIGDLLSDVDESNSINGFGIQQLSNSTLNPILDSQILHPEHLTNLFQEHYEQLDKALSGTGHSWTALTLKLCTALEMAKKLIQTTSSDSEVLLGKVRELKRILNRRDAAIEALKGIQGSVKNN